jgi:hypothetical protein
MAEGRHLGRVSVVGLGCREAVVGWVRMKAGEQMAGEGWRGVVEGSTVAAAAMQVVGIEEVGLAERVDNTVDPSVSVTVQYAVATAAPVVRIRSAHILHSRQEDTVPEPDIRQEHNSHSGCDLGSLHGLSGCNSHVLYVHHLSLCHGIHHRHDCPATRSHCPEGMQAVRKLDILAKTR